MAKVEITPHAKEQCLKRIPRVLISRFLGGVERGTYSLPGGKERWAIAIWLKEKPELVGFAVGEGLVWQTTLSGGMTPDKRSQTVIVKV